MNAKNSIGQTSTLTGALPGSAMLCNDEVAVVVSLGMDAAVKKCYQQFTVDENLRF